MKISKNQLLLLSSNIHPDCKSVAEKTLNLAYYSNNQMYNNKMKDKCLYCGDPLLCNNILKNHIFKKLSLQEITNKKLPTGKCINNYICVDCGFISTIDSSD